MFFCLVLDMFHAKDDTFRTGFLMFASFLILGLYDGVKKHVVTVKTFQKLKLFFFVSRQLII